MTRINKNGGIPLEAQYMYHRALYHSIQGEKEAALDDFRRAVAIAPRFSEALNAMGTCLDELERYNEAVMKFDKVIEIDPHHEEARLKRDRLLKKIRFSDTAAADPEKKHRIL